MNPMPASAIHRETSSGPSSIPAPSASRTSALPAWLVAALLPCLATTTPAPRATNAAAVETFIVPFASPPVPQVSTTPSWASTLAAKRGKERGRGRRGSIALHDGLQRAFRLALGQNLPIGGPAKRIAQHDSGSEPQEVLQEVVAASGQDALGVELDALDGVFAVPDAHYRTVFGAAGDEKAFRDRLWFDHERMVACRLEALGKAFVDPTAVVHNPRRLAVYWLAAHYLGTKSLPDGLVAEADTKGGNILTDLLDQLDRDPGLVRRAGTGGDYYPIRVERGDFLRRDLIVAPHEDLGPELPEILDKVVGKGVVVVYDEDPHKWSDFSG